MYFEKIVILGTGKLALDCADHVKQMDIDYELFDMNEIQMDRMEKMAKSKELNYYHLEKQKTMNQLRGQEGKVLLVSAINPCIIPKDILEKKNITAVNCHQALLPKHPGRNAEAWAIYEQDKASGITWHYMTSVVDEGDILVQKEIPLEENITSFQLFRQQMDSAFEGFRELLEMVEAGPCKGIRQLRREKGKLHYSWEIPNDGYLNIYWNSEKISAFLRAMDYSALKVLGEWKVIYEGIEYAFSKYKIQKLDKKAISFQCVMDGDTLIVEKEMYRFYCKSCKMVQQQKVKNIG